MTQRLAEKVISQATREMAATPPIGAKYSGARNWPELITASTAMVATISRPRNRNQPEALARLGATHSRTRQLA